MKLAKKLHAKKHSDKSNVIDASSRFGTGSSPIKVSKADLTPVFTSIHPNSRRGANAPERIGRLLTEFSGEGSANKSSKELRNRGTRAVGATILALTLAGVAYRDYTNTNEYTVQVEPMGIDGQWGQTKTLVADLREKGATVSNSSAASQMVGPEVENGGFATYKDNTGVMGRNLERLGNAIGVDYSLDDLIVTPMDRRYDIPKDVGS